MKLQGVFLSAMLKGISTLVDLTVPLPRLLEQIAAAGFECVSLSHDVGHSGYHSASGRAELRRLLAECGLSLNYIHPPIQPYYDLSSLDSRVRAFSVQMHAMVIEVCSELGGRSVTAHICNERRLPESELESRIAAALTSLDELGPLAERCRVHFCVENLPCPMAAQDITETVLARCERPDIHVTLDPNHAWIRCPDPYAQVERLAPRVRATHMSDTLGDHDSHLLPGAGIVDFAHVAATLARAGYCAARGDVLDLECSIEMQRRRLRTGTPHPGDPADAAALPDTADYLKAACAAAVRMVRQIEAARVEAA